MTEIDHQNVSIYTETLFALARDAWKRGHPEAFDFIKGYLVGLVPSSALDAFIAELDPNHGTSLRAYKPAQPYGGVLVPKPVPPPTQPPSPTRLTLDDLLGSKF